MIWYVDICSICVACVCVYVFVCCVCDMCVSSTSGIVLQYGMWVCAVCIWEWWYGMYEVWEGMIYMGMFNIL